jgi:hypothetical protein
LSRLFEHPLRFRAYIPSAIVSLGAVETNQCEIGVRWRSSTSQEEHEEDLRLSWDLAAIRQHFEEIDEEIAILRQRDEDQALRTELAAIVVAVAVMSKIDPNARFTRRSGAGTRHDYYLNETRDEMIEIAGRSQGSLDALFQQKRVQSDLNPTLQKR